MKWKVPLFKSYWEEDDIESVAKVIRRGTYWATGPEIKEFEDKIAKFVGTKYALAFNSGTSALHSILLSYNIGKGDEVIVPSFTFIATGNAPLFVGAKPVFAEIEDRTFGLEIEDVKNKITKKTKAIMPIHYGGCPCVNIKDLKELAEDHKLLLIEDAAQSLGAKIKDKKVGCFGDAAMFSLCQDKMITTGDGGVIVTASKDCYEKSKLIRSHGRAESSDYFSSSELMDYVSLGYNFRMPTMIAALGISQLKKINKIIKFRRKNAELYTSKLSDIDEITLPSSPKDFFHVYQKYTIQTDEKNREKLKDHLRKKGIFSKAYFGLPVHLTKFYRDEFGYKNGDLPKTEKMSKRVLTLPMFPALENKDLDYVASSIKDYFK
ncbi:MAG: DegT/DnrJ/EryC1/StrS family aminotransferase [Thermoplasmatales archaeon]|nr:DegT/DnrJ/EryC1/StrS family aminotransferase [Thermoplasmatales archaeon]